ncbi:MFS transporter [Leptothoe spongobia]|uniref:MFS transporter n=1 Tax=Leptothoe spongobia TAU-MAC 1115 TaxID=1967444 RepID=A0A947GKG2_9CYAN|nr:MFS transporter [Leptothoe spongobia]MBT9317379.1 MFS transporter [Leptothoe spongobia TAU-MAC 1115]
MGHNLEVNAKPVAGIRWLIPPILAITVFVNFLTRNSLALALPQIAQDFGWSNRELGSNGELLLGIFFISYSLANMALSPMAERFGPKRSLLIAMAVFCSLTIFCAPLGTSLLALIILRLLLGLSQGIHIPMMSVFISRWFPLEERSRANGIWSMGLMLAVSIAPLIVVPLSNALGWRLAFAIIGGAGLFIAMPLMGILVQDHPHQNPSIAPDELAYIRSHSVVSSTKEPSQKSGLTGSQPFIKDRRFWIATLGGSLNNFCSFGILSWLPVYLNRAKGIDFDALGWPLAIVFAVGIVGIMVMAVVGDLIQKRTLLAAIGFLIAGPVLYLATTTQQIGLLVALFATAVFCQSAYLAQEYALIQRLLPISQIGVGTGIYNGLAVLFGGVGGSFIPGSIVAATGSLDLGMLSVVVGSWLASFVMFILARLAKY